MKKVFIFVTLFFLTNAEIPLFKKYPKLRKKIAHLNLGNFPTPIQDLPKLGSELGLDHLFCKREDLSGGLKDGKRLFGGNKVRKLEFLLADADWKRYRSVVTFGGIGSNHVAATACYAHGLGLDCYALLSPQPITSVLKRNLFLDHFYGCQVFEFTGNRIPTGKALKKLLTELNVDPNAYVIPLGGSNILGVISQINAIFELKEQIEKGLMPEPDYIYLPFGSMGTTAGLFLGIKLAGLKTKLRPVRVVSPEKFNSKTLCKLIHDTNKYLHTIDPSIPLTHSCKEIEIINNYFGNGYAHSTPEAEAAVALFKEKEGLQLDITYSGKAAAALIADVKNGSLKRSNVVLFWYTFCADDFEDLIFQVDPNSIPDDFQKYLN